MPPTAEIDDVGKSASAYAWSHYGPVMVVFYGLALLAVGYVLYAFFVAQAASDTISPLLIFIPLAIAAVPIAIQAHAQSKFQRAFMMLLAESLGFSYASDAVMDTVAGAAFNVGRGQKIRDVLAGTYKNHLARIFTYQYTVPHGKTSRTYTKTIFEFDFGAPLPHLILRHALVWSGFGEIGDVETPHDVEPVTLEGDFNESIALYVEKGRQMEAREILQPDLMAALTGDYKAFDLEICGTKLYVLRSSVISTRADFNTMNALVDKLLDAVIPSLHSAAEDESQKLSD